MDLSTRGRQPSGAGQNGAAPLMAVSGSWLQMIQRFSRNARLFLIYALLADLGVGIWRVMFALYLLAAGFNLDFIGLVVATNLLLHGLFAFPAGLIADKMGRKFVFIVASTSAVVFRAFLLFTLDPLWVLILMAGSGMGDGFHAVASGPFIMENSQPEERPHLFALQASFLNLSAFTGAMAAGFLPAFWGGILGVIPAHYTAVRLALVISLPLTLLSLLPLIFLREHRLPQDMIDSFAELFTLRNIQSRGIIARLVVCTLVYGLFFGLVIPFFSVFFREAHLLPYQSVGTIMAAGFIGAVVGTLVLGPLVTRKFGKARGIWLVLWVAAPSVALMAYMPALPLVVVFFLVSRAFFSISMPLRNQLAMELVVTRERGTTNGLIHGAMDIVGSPAAALAGVILASGNFTLTFSMAAVLVAIPGVLYYYFFHKLEERQLQVRLDGQQFQPRPRLAL
ncbi:MAG: MFS transporter [Chloroflexi bacterium]|nr:MFS transporter [Chloroflexota bacterium]MBI3931198.1 MFS transporter [Chloroflexota bacterium]